MEALWAYGSGLCGFFIVSDAKAGQAQEAQEAGERWREVAIRQFGV